MSKGHIPLLAALSLVLCACQPFIATTEADAGVPSPVVGLAATVNGSRVTLTWTNPSDATFERALVVRYTDARFGVPPGNRIPKVGETLGGGIVVANARLTTFTDNQPPQECGAITYQVWALDSSGSAAESAPSVVVDGRLLSSAPNERPTDVSLAYDDAGTVTLAWKNPRFDAGANEVVAVRKKGEVPASPSDGTLLYQGANDSLVDSLPFAMPATGVGYAVFACNRCGQCSSQGASAKLELSQADAGAPDAGFDGGSSVLDAGPVIDHPVGLTAAISSDGRAVVLAWTNPPADAGQTSVIVKRALNQAPSGPGDSAAHTVFSGQAASATEPLSGLLPNSALTARSYTYAVYGCKSSVCETEGSRATLTVTVTQALRGGGYTLFWRHATANVCADNLALGFADAGTSPSWWKSCDSMCSTATARQLDGVNSTQETTAIHNAFVTKGITVGRVLSSEYCRCVQTAQGLNFGPAIEQVPALTYYVYDDSFRCVNTMALMNQVPTVHTNTALVSHAGFTCPVLDGLAWGEAAIFKPGAGQATYIARVPWNGWANLP